jgi:hypothetical protein
MANELAINLSKSTSNIVGITTQTNDRYQMQLLYNKNIYCKGDLGDEWDLIKIFNRLEESSLSA